MHEPLDLDNPKGYNAKLQWLKLYDRNPAYTLMTDKYLVRNYVRDRIGEKYLIPLLGVWNNAFEINFDALPNQFVLKCNHDSGSVVICCNKNRFNINKAIYTIERHRKQDYFWKGREFNYRYIKRKILAEKYISNKTSDANSSLTDFKFFCFDGIPKFIQVDMNRFTDHIRNFYTPDWDFIDVEYGIKNDKNRGFPKPIQLDKMLELSHKLSAGFPHIRVDFYISDGHIYFGELTFHHGGGVMAISPRKFDYLWGDYLKLPNVADFS